MKRAKKLGLRDLLEEIRDDEAFGPETRGRVSELLSDLSKQKASGKKVEENNEDKG